MSRVALSMLLVAGCDGVFGVDKLPVPDPCWREPFDDSPEFAMRWEDYADSPAFSAVPVAGRLEMTMPPSTAGYAGLVSTDVYDFNNAEASIHVVTAVSQTGNVENVITVGGASGERYVMAALTNELSMYLQHAGAPEYGSAITFDATNHAYWKIAHDLVANMMVFSTSADRIKWLVRHRVPIEIDLDSVVFNLAAGQFGTGNSVPGKAVYDDFERCPP